MGVRRVELLECVKGGCSRVAGVGGYKVVLPLLVCWGVAGLGFEPLEGPVGGCVVYAGNFRHGYARGATGFLGIIIGFLGVIVGVAFGVHCLWFGVYGLGLSLWVLVLGISGGNHCVVLKGLLVFKIHRVFKKCGYCVLEWGHMGG